MKKLITKAVTGKVQHKRPCSDCPWRRDSLPGWLGAIGFAEWLQVAHSDSRVDCHVVSNMQCAGLATYRANVAKQPRDPKILLLPKDTTNVFATPMEFSKHHDCFSKSRKTRS